jgi:hypothetical protein
MNELKIKQLVLAITVAPTVCVDYYISEVFLLDYKLRGETVNAVLQFSWTQDSHENCRIITDQGFSDARIEYNEIRCSDSDGIEVLISLHRLVADNTFLSKID